MSTKVHSAGIMNFTCNSVDTVLLIDTTRKQLCYFYLSCYQYNIIYKGIRATLYYSQMLQYEYIVIIKVHETNILSVFYSRVSVLKAKLQLFYHFLIQYCRSHTSSKGNKADIYQFPKLYSVYCTTQKVTEQQLYHFYIMKWTIY